MTDFTRDWIAKREVLGKAATEGPWSVTHGPRELPRIWSDAPQFESAEFIAKCAFAGDVVDAEFIADARTSLPAALAALRAVLELANNHYPDARNISGRDLVRAVEAALRGKP